MRRYIEAEIQLDSTVVAAGLAARGATGIVMNEAEAIDGHELKQVASNTFALLGHLADPVKVTERARLREVRAIDEEQGMIVHLVGK